MENLTSQLARDYYHRQGLFYHLPAPQSYEEMRMTPEKPLVLNNDFFKREFAFVHSHMKDWIPEIQNELHEDNGLTSPLSFNRSDFDEVKARLSAASQLAVRYKNYSCQLNQLAAQKRTMFALTLL